MGAQEMVLYPKAWYTLVATHYDATEEKVRELIQTAHNASPWVSRYPHPMQPGGTVRVPTKNVFSYELTINGRAVKVESHPPYGILPSSMWAYNQYVRRQAKLLKTFPKVLGVSYVSSEATFVVSH